MLTLEVFSSFASCQRHLTSVACLEDLRERGERGDLSSPLSALNSQAVFATKLKPLPGGFWWRGSWLKLLLWERAEKGKESQEKKPQHPNPFEKCSLSSSRPSWYECWLVTRCDCRSADVNQMHGIYLFIEAFAFWWIVFFSQGTRLRSGCSTHLATWCCTEQLPGEVLAQERVRSGRC